MQALIFAAGLGTRLGRITERGPKALVEVGGMAMLERVCRRLVRAGVTRMVVNVHPFADRIARFLEERGDFGVEVRLSREEEAPLETGGGLKRAALHLRPDEPTILHNVDVLTDLPLEAMVAAHEKRGPLATLAVMERPSSRGLLFDEQGLLGRVDDEKGLDLRVRDTQGEPCRLAFAGIHVIDPSLPGRITEEGAFSILAPYLRLAGEGATLLPFRVDGSTWLDIGRPAQLEEAQRLVREIPTLALD